MNRLTHRLNHPSLTQFKFDLSSDEPIFYLHRTANSLHLVRAAIKNTTFTKQNKPRGTHPKWNYLGKELNACSLARWRPVWPDRAILCILGNFLKLLATINFHKSPPFIGNFCKGVKILDFSSEIIFGQLLQTFGDFFLVTLLATLFRMSRELLLDLFRG